MLNADSEKFFATRQIYFAQADGGLYVPNYKSKFSQFQTNFDGNFKLIRDFVVAFTRLFSLNPAATTFLQHCEI